MIVKCRTAYCPGLLFKEVDGSVWCGMCSREAAAPPPKPVKYAPVKWNKKAWSRGYDECERCHTVDVPHHAHGLCKSCFYEARRETQRVG